MHCPGKGGRPFTPQSTLPFLRPFHFFQISSFQTGHFSNVGFIFRIHCCDLTKARGKRFFKTRYSEKSPASVDMSAGASQGPSKHILRRTRWPVGRARWLHAFSLLAVKGAHHPGPTAQRHHGWPAWPVFSAVAAGPPQGLTPPLPCPSAPLPLGPLTQLAEYKVRKKLKAAGVAKLPYLQNKGYRWRVTGQHTGAWSFSAQPSILGTHHAVICFMVCKPRC